MLDKKQLNYVKICMKNFGVDKSIVLLDLLYDSKQLSLEVYDEMKDKITDNSK